MSFKDTDTKTCFSDLKIKTFANIPESMSGIAAKNNKQHETFKYNTVFA